MNVKIEVLLKLLCRVVMISTHCKQGRARHGKESVQTKASTTATRK